MLLANCAEVVARELESRDPGRQPSPLSTSATAVVGGNGHTHSGGGRASHRSSHDGGSARNGSAYNGSGHRMSPAPPPQAATALPVQLLDVSYGYTVGGVPVKRFSFERSGSGGSAYSRYLAVPPSMSVLPACLMISASSACETASIPALRHTAGAVTPPRPHQSALATILLTDISSTMPGPAAAAPAGALTPPRPRRSAPVI